MSYVEDDLKFPAQANKVRLAKKRFVEKGATDLVNLASMIGLDPQYLKKRAEEENWSEIRFQSLMTHPSDKVAAFEKKLDKVDDPMERHAMVADFLVSMALDFAKVLSTSDTLTAMDATILRGRILNLKDLTEAAAGAVEMSRGVRGIQEGTPSSGRVTEATTVRYEVSIADHQLEIA